MRQHLEEWPTDLELEVSGIRSDTLLSGSSNEYTEISLSAFEAFVHVHGHQRLVVSEFCCFVPEGSYYIYPFARSLGPRLKISLPYAVDPAQALCMVDPHRHTLSIRLVLDNNAPADACDPGSKPWMLARALSNSSSQGGEFPSGMSIAQGERTSTGLPSLADDEEEELPEDKVREGERCITPVLSY